MIRIYQLHPMTDEPALPDKTWLSEKRRSLAFPCEHWRREVVEPIVLRAPGQDVALSFVAGSVGSLIREDLRQALDPEFDNLVRVTQVEMADGTPSPYQAYWPNCVADFRGNKKSYCYRCDTCRHMYYTPMGERYLLRCDLPDLPLFVTAAGYIVVNEDLYQRVTQQAWRRISIFETPLLDKPRDGFPIDLATLRPEQERRFVGRKINRSGS